MDERNQTPNVTFGNTRAETLSFGGAGVQHSACCRVSIFCSSTVVPDLIQDPRSKIPQEFWRESWIRSGPGNDSSKSKILSRSPVESWILDLGLGQVPVPPSTP